MLLIHQQSSKENSLAVACDSLLELAELLSAILILGELWFSD